MAIALQISKGLNRPPRATKGSANTLVIHAGTIPKPQESADPWAFWDGRELVSNLPGSGLIRRFGGITLEFYESLWHEAPPPPSTTSQPDATVLQIPSYRIDGTSYYDGPVLGYFAGDSSRNGLEPRFVLPLGSYRYDGPFAPVEPVIEDDLIADITSARLLRAPLSQAVRLWLSTRYPAGPHPLIQVTLGPSGDFAAQALALVYLKMSDYCAAIAVGSLDALPKAKAQGFKALARNLGCYVAKAQPPARLRAEAVTLSLAELASLCTAPHRVSDGIADFNSVSALIPRDLLPDQDPK